MIRSFLLLFLYCFNSESMHFNGGTINWAPMDPNRNGTVVPISITQSYSWTYPATNCTKDVPITTTGRERQNVNLTCVAGCSTDGGYSARPVNILTDCQASSSSLGLMTSQRTVYRNLTADAHFSVAYTGAAWIDLDSPPEKDLPWSLVASIDLRRRLDGLINTPPVASVVSPQYAIVNQLTQITVPVSDANSGDDIRCRWAVSATPLLRRKRSDDDEAIGTGTNNDSCTGCTSTCQFNSPCCCPACARTTCTGSRCASQSGCTALKIAPRTVDVTQSKALIYGNELVNECGGICYPNTVPADTTLSGSNCTISFKGTVPNTWYAVAIQVEDFIDSTSETPMSSIPVQFLIYVTGGQACGSRPVILPVQRCLDVQVGVPISFNISAMTTCSPNVSDIEMITIASGIDGMNISNTIHSTANASLSYATFAWTPRTDQVGPHQLCFVAFSQEKFQSTQYCLIFNVTTSAAICGATTVTTSTTTTTSSTTTSRTTTTTTTRTTTTTTTRTTTTTTSTSTTTTTSTTVSTTSTTVLETIGTTFPSTSIVIITSGQTTLGGIKIDGTLLGIIVSVCGTSLIVLFGCCCCCCCRWDSIQKHTRTSHRVEPLEEVRVEECRQEPPVMYNPPPTIRRTPFMIALVRPPGPPVNYSPRSFTQPSRVTRAISGPRIAKPGNVIVF